MKIVYDPCTSFTNRYVVKIATGLRKQGYHILSLPTFLGNLLKYRNVKIIHLNWFESIVGESRIALLQSFLKQYTKLLLLEVLRKKIVWTMHNRMPHDQRFQKLHELLLTKLIKQSKAIVIHSKLSQVILKNDYGVDENKVFYCPHPDYINEYGPMEAAIEKDDSKTLKLLFMGAVKPYKNIELLIEVVKNLEVSTIELTIAGKPVSVEYGIQLEHLVKNVSNIHLELTFIPDDLIPGYLNACDALVLPYDLRSSLNSGTVLLAFSYARSVICPDIGTLQDLDETLRTSVFTYSYSTVATHKEALETAILKAQNAQGELNKFGKNLLDYMQQNHSVAQVVDSLEKVYKSL
ncbi:glycosyltransferase family 4 protein [Leeuwenhoekiella blandensis]|uniref:GumI protein n=1 Tax=Leeuwenhoekiella blandensis (strain CECT 7118 / CCUG 51940 / KCTC 22103 / MED217) TaxID=398720 RepID=A3XR80_LEEBM|nr:glycosyltransferase family 4 protein [Leeuwenhoekiella blandensis]EAQ47945.1 GumI protein [Leeuwenhoekiella blandensis MED217]